MVSQHEARYSVGGGDVGGGAREGNLDKSMIAQKSVKERQKGVGAVEIFL